MAVTDSHAGRARAERVSRKKAARSKRQTPAANTQRETDDLITDVSAATIGTPAQVEQVEEEHGTPTSLITTPEREPIEEPSVSRTSKHPKKLKKVAKAARRYERQPTATYCRIRDAWHEAVAPEQLASLQVERGAGALPPLVLAPVNSGGLRVSVVPADENGGFSPQAQQEAARALAPVQRKKPHPIAPHLLDLVYRSMRHFNAPLVHVISGYRADRAGSRHTQGRAIDFVIPGVSNDQLAAYVRQFGFVGVGVYPKSGFVHLDVRPQSFFWIDNSLPDEHCRTQPTLVEEAKRADQAARERGEEPDIFVPHNEREDRAATRSYKRRASQRRAKAQQVRPL